MLMNQLAPSNRPDPAWDKPLSPRKSDESDESDGSDNIGRIRTVSDSTGRGRTESDSGRTRGGARFKGNLTAEIREWIKESTGSFTVADIDREFGLVLRQDKKRRSDALKKIREENLILRDRKKTGTYRIVTDELEFIDLEAEPEDNFSLSLPLGLSEKVSIPPKSIMVLAGSPNSGKTCLALNILRANMGEQPLLYLMSEMGGTEYRQRVSAFGDELSVWKKYVRASSLSTGFEGPVKHHNSDGLTVIDFLEEVDGEYYRIASDLRAIYDALGLGVALVLLQKKDGSPFGRGGQATTEKARLYLTLDTLLHRPHFTVASLRIGKAKSYPRENPNGKERHFKIIRGCQIEPLCPWQYMDDKQRSDLVAGYEIDRPW